MFVQINVETTLLVTVIDVEGSKLNISILHDGSRRQKDCLARGKLRGGKARELNDRWRPRSADLLERAV
jgi:hypothetical protein